LSDPQPQAAMLRHYVEHTRPAIVEDLALDEALLEEAEAGGPPILRIWEPTAVAVVLGASCRLREDVRVEACREDGVAIVRRSSGGGTVVVGPGVLNVTVVLPVDYAPGLAAVDYTQRFVLERIAVAIRAQGPQVEVMGSGDLTLGLRKCAGSAQRRLRRHFLVHASILYRFPSEEIGRYTTHPARQPAYRQGRSHEEFVVNLEMPRERLVAAVRSAWLDPDAPTEPVLVPEERMAHLIAEKFADPAWIERL